MTERYVTPGPFDRWQPVGVPGSPDHARELEAELDDIRYVVRTEEVYIGSGPNAELHHLGDGRVELTWEVDDLETRPIGRQLATFDSRLGAEAFVREHAARLYVGGGVETLALHPPTPEQLALSEQVARELGLR